MNRKEMLRPLLNQAQFNGFEFRRWFQRQVHPIWPGAEQALELLGTEGRYYTLLFAHDFARNFWKSGAQMSFTVPGTTYARVTANGNVVHVTRKPFTRRMIKRDVWKYHLRQMAAADDPILYLARFLPQSVQAAAQKPLHDRIAARA
ncbi:MAG: hypothetical protein WBE76_01950 [Terracidiphilus sp.]